MNSQDILLSDDEQIELKRRVRSATISQRYGRRARVILLAVQGHSRKEIAEMTLCAAILSAAAGPFQVRHLPLIPIPFKPFQPLCLSHLPFWQASSERDFN